MVTRAEIADVLRRWQAGEVSARHVFDWAEERYWPGDEVEFDDWEADESSVANEVLGVLDQLPMNLVLPEDVPTYLEFLAAPPGHFGRAYEQFSQALDRIDHAARRRALKGDEFYGRFCQME